VSTVQRAVEVAATVVLLAGSAWLGQLVYHNNWGHVSQEPAPANFPEEIVARTSTGTPTVVQRDRLGDKAVFLVLSVDCRYCKENGPNWKALVEEIGDDAGSDVRVSVLSLSSPEDTAGYLEEHGISAPVLHIDRAELGVLGLRGVPATLGVSPRGGTMRAWTGVLDDAVQATILAWTATSRTN